MSVGVVEVSTITTSTMPEIACIKLPAKGVTISAISGFKQGPHSKIFSAATTADALSDSISLGSLTANLAKSFNLVCAKQE